MANATANLTTMAALNEQQLPQLRHWLYLTNLFIYAVEFPISMFSAFCLLSSSILHPNLRLILVCQNACFLVFALSRTVQIGIVFGIGPSAWESYKSIQCGILFTTLYGNMIGHILLLERFLATYFVKDYEHKPKLWFSFGWFPLLFTISLLNAYSETYQSTAADASLNVTIGTIVSLCVSMAMSFAEIFILSLMGVHNRKAYNAQRGNQSGRTLTERYQLSENIRTSKQLSPTFLFHFANVCCTTALGICMYFALVEDIFTLMAVIFWLNSLFNTIIECSVIIGHPLLRRNAKASLGRLLPSACLLPAVPQLGGTKVHNASCTGNNGQMSGKTTVSGTERNAPKNIDGQRLIHSPGHEDYFRFLANSWQMSGNGSSKLGNSTSNNFGVGMKPSANN